jgi:hypothetical protein
MTKREQDDVRVELPAMLANLPTDKEEMVGSILDWRSNRMDEIVRSRRARDLTSRVKNSSTPRNPSSAQRSLSAIGGA